MMQSRTEPAANTAQKEPPRFFDLKHGFRRGIDLPSYPERATHMLHPYPAKLLPHIPYYALRRLGLEGSNAVVLDPYCGSGTVLLEARLLGCRAIGADVNPFARLLARVKTRPLSHELILHEGDRTTRRARRIHPPSDPPDVVNIRTWYMPRVIRPLHQLRIAIEAIRDEPLREFFLVCLSNCARRLSLADPRIGVPVRLKVEKYRKSQLYERLRAHAKRVRTTDPLELFDLEVQRAARRVASMKAYAGESQSSEVCDPMSDGKKWALPLRNNSVDIAITSPPYAAAQKYIRATSLSLGWLGLCSSTSLRGLEEKQTGREHFRKRELEQAVLTQVASADAVIASVRVRNPLRAHIAATYLLELQTHFTEIGRTLKPGGRFIVVIGANRICGRVFDTPRYVREIAAKAGFEHVEEVSDKIRTRSLQTARNRTASTIREERIIVLRKPPENPNAR